MADNRIPLIVNSTANQIQELPTDDNLVLNDTNKLIMGTQGELEIFHDANGVSRIIHIPPSSGNDLRLQIGPLGGDYTASPLVGAQFHIEKKITAGGDGHNFITCDYDSNETRIQFADTSSGSTKLTTIGTGCTITGDIHASGKIVPSLGSGTGNGIRWPENPGAGSANDFASITYYAESSGNTKLKISTGNEANDDIEIVTSNDGFTTVSATGDATSSTTGAFRVSGGVGIGKKLFVGTEFKIGSATGSTAVDIIRDEDDMISNDPDALATQQSIKKYVDDSTSASGNALALTADDGGATTIIFATETLDIEGTANEIKTATGDSPVAIPANTLRIGLTNDVTIANDLTVTRNLTAAKINVDDIELDGSKIVLDNNPSTQGELEISYESSSGTSRIIHTPPTGGDDLRLQIGAINGNYSGTPSGTQLILEKKVNATTNGHNFITCDYDSNETRICYANSSTGSIRLTTKQDGVDINGILNVSGKLYANNTGQSSSTTSGSIITAGGIGLAGNIHVGGNAIIGGTFKIGSGEDVNIIRDDDTFNDNDPNALATQQSIKAYVDNEVDLALPDCNSAQLTSTYTTTNYSSGSGDPPFETVLTVTITPKTSSSKFLVMLAGNSRYGTSGFEGDENSSAITRCFEQVGSGTDTAIGVEMTNARTSNETAFSFDQHILRGPAGNTTQRTYRLKIKANDRDEQVTMRAGASLTVLEVI